MFTKEEKILGLASLAALGAYMLRKKQGPAASADGAEGSGWSFTPYEQEPKEMFVSNLLANDAAICQQWKTGNNRLPWGTVQWAKVEAAVDAGLEAHAVKRPADMFIAKELNFRVVKHAVSMLCPEIDLPSTKKGLELILPKSPMWFKDLWERVNTISWDRFTALMGSDA